MIVEGGGREVGVAQDNDLLEQKRTYNNRSQSSPTSLKLT